jgi:hypothetical protein
MLPCGTPFDFKSSSLDSKLKTQIEIFLPDSF